MMQTIVRSGAVVLLVVVVGCGGSGPTSPSASRQPAPSPTPIAFPPLSGPSRTFAFASQVNYPVRDFTKQSSFVLYENGAFGLRYEADSTGPAFTYSGQYQNANGVLMLLFEFQGRSVYDLWDDARGMLKGDSLTIQFQESMQHADFEDAVYVLMR